MARVSVKTFATVREAAGVPFVEMEASTIDELISKLERQFGPKFSRLLRKSAHGQNPLVLLLNGRTLRPSQTDIKLKDGDEVAIFPPVSGG